MVDEVLRDCEQRMKKAVDALRKEFRGIRAGRATPALLDKITVEYYGVETPLNQVSNISAPEARLLVIQPWDKSIIPNIEKAIMQSDLGLNPSNDGNVIRLSIPTLTEERRKELDRLVRKMAEESRVAVRNIRRDANDSIKSLEDEGEISQDQARRALDKIQELTDKYVAEVDKVLKEKEAEIMEV